MHPEGTKEMRRIKEPRDEIKFKDKMMKLHFRNEDCILVFQDHVIRKREGSRKAEVYIRIINLT